MAPHMRCVSRTGSSRTPARREMGSKVMAANGSPASRKNPAHIVQLFDAPRSLADAVSHYLIEGRAEGQHLLVIAREGYDFRERFEVPEHKSGHGSLVRSHMQTPLWSNVPVPDGPVRTVEVFTAMLSWLGVDAPDGIDASGVWLPGRPAQEAVGSA